MTAAQAPGEQQPMDASQAYMLGGIQTTLNILQGTSAETLRLVQGQEQRIGKTEAELAVHTNQIAGHDREFGEIRGMLTAINVKLDARGLTWPKLLAGGAATIAIVGGMVGMVVAVMNTLADIAAKLG